MICKISRYPRVVRGYLLIFLEKVVYFSFAICKGVSLPKTGRYFFSKENYPRRVDTDKFYKKIDKLKFILYYINNIENRNGFYNVEIE